MQNNDQSWFVVLNPQSGGFKKWPRIKAIMEKRSFPFVSVESKSIKHLDRIIPEALENGYKNFLAIGGDGSCHVLINALMNLTEIQRENVTFANITCGTGNDWQRGRGWPKKILQQIVNLENNTHEWVDLGKVTYPDHQNASPHYFLNMLGLSYDAYVVHNLNNAEKKNIGPLVYIFSVIKYIFKYEIPEFILSFNGREIKDFLYTINIGLGTHAGGGMQICPHARQRKDRFALLIAHKMSKARVLWESIRFYTGTIHKSTKTECYYTKEIVVRKPNGILQVEADGEVLKDGPIHVYILNKALRTISC